MATPATSPGALPIYRRRHAPAHLRTYTQLKAAGLRPAHISKPDAVYFWGQKPDGSAVWMWLYDVRQARAYVCANKHASAGKRPRGNLRQSRVQ
jgi:hypothetical protein